MRLIVDEYGTAVKKDGNRFILKSDGRTCEFSSDVISQILVMKSSMITHDAIGLASSKDIDIVFFDKWGRPSSRLSPCQPGKNASIRRKQVLLFGSEKGNLFSISLIHTKIKNQAAILRRYAKSHNNNTLKQGR